MLFCRSSQRHTSRPNISYGCGELFRLVLTATAGSREFPIDSWHDRYHPPRTGFPVKAESRESSMSYIAETSAIYSQGGCPQPTKISRCYLHWYRRYEKHFLRFSKTAKIPVFFKKNLGGNSQPASTRRLAHRYRGELKIPKMNSPTAASSS